VLAPRRDVKSMRVAFLLSLTLAVQAAPAPDQAAARQTVAPGAQASPAQTVQTPGQPPANPAAQPPAVEDKAKKEKPSLSVRASPPISFSPATIHVVGELKGGPDDYEDLYCMTLEWDWGDGTRSEAAADCDPYQAGVTQILRRFSTDHVYNTSGRFRVSLRLKRNTKVVTSATTNIQVRPGLRDMDPYDR
jgi:hypothetical protein